MENLVAKRHHPFVSEPIGDKPVTAVPGIGAAVGKKLKQQGFDKANKLLGQFLLLDRDTERFIEWFRHTSLASPQHARICANCLKDWSENFI